MERIDIISSRAVVLAVDNVDTDQIIPARFLKATSRSGFGEALFADWRMGPDFCINKAVGSILVSGSNFGCGSSREHAAWALYDYGFRAVVSDRFADIFRGNALNNGLLPIEVSEDFLKFLSACNEVITIDLGAQTICCDSRRERFEIDGYKKECLLNGQDDIDYLVSIYKEIEKYEVKNRTA